MITEDYVSFETAKLLKEKGFDEPCHCTYKIIISKPRIYYSPDEVTNSNLSENYANIEFGTLPTLQMAMKWLREVHNLHCNSDYDFVLGWYCEITSLKETIEYDYEEMKHYHPDHNYGFSTPEEACEAAIKYCLENLI